MTTVREKYTTRMLRVKTLDRVVEHLARQRASLKKFRAKLAADPRVAAAVLRTYLTKYGPATRRKIMRHTNITLASVLDAAVTELGDEIETVVCGANRRGRRYSLCSRLNAGPVRVTIR